MLHEAMHQLTREVSGIKYSRWMEEGLAAYFATSQLTKGGLKLGVIDWNTYPAWGLGGYEYSGDLRRDANEFQFIRLEQLITGKDGPSVDERFNLYYVSAWSLTHFLIHFEEGKYLEGYKQFRAGDATWLNFVARVGALDQIEEEWYRYLSLNLRPLFDKHLDALGASDNDRTHWTPTRVKPQIAGAEMEGALPISAPITATAR